VVIRWLGWVGADRGAQQSQQQRAAAERGIIESRCDASREEIPQRNDRAQSPAGLLDLIIPSRAGGRQAQGAVVSPVLSAGIEQGSKLRLRPGVGSTR